MQPGMRKKRSMEKILLTITIAMIEYSKHSTIMNAKLLSRIPKSFENLLASWPVEIKSKKDEGLLTSPWIISAWRSSFEERTIRYTKKYLMIEKKK